MAFLVRVREKRIPVIDVHLFPTQPSVVRRKQNSPSHTEILQKKVGVIVALRNRKLRENKTKPDTENSGVDLELHVKREEGQTSHQGKAGGTFP